MRSRPNAPSRARRWKRRARRADTRRRRAGGHKGKFVAHGARRRRLARSLACAAVLALAPGAVGAIALGEPQVRSALGEPLDARIPVTLAPGESIQPSCFSLVRDEAAAGPQLTAARISVERSAGGARLRIQSRAPLEE